MTHRFENLTREERDFLTSLFLEIFMSTVEDQIVALTTKVDALTTAVAAIPTAPVAANVDFTPVLTPLAALQVTANAILAQDEPTPASSGSGTATS